MLIREATHYDVPAIARVQVDTWRTTYRGIVPDQHLANLSYERRAKGWHEILDRAAEDRSFTFVAEESSGEIVGFVNGGKERKGDPIYQGELTAIYIQQNHQGKGIGRGLVQASVERLNQMSLRSMLVWVLADNPARYFYSTLGGLAVREETIVIGGRSLIEIAYGWRDTTVLRTNKRSSTV